MNFKEELFQRNRISLSLYQRGGTKIWSGSRTIHVLFR